MKFFARLAAVCACIIGVATSAGAQTVLSGGGNITISVGGSYILGGNVSTINVTAGYVTLDLGGRTVASSAICPLINNGATAGCTCSTGAQCTGTTPGIKITGNNVTIKNGFVTHQFGDGIAIFSPTGTGMLNATIKDVSISEVMGNGIGIYGSGASLSNVKVTQSGHDGINVGDAVTFDHVVESYSNGYGVSAAGGAGSYTDVSVQYNAQWGIIANGDLTRVLSRHNTGTGIYVSGVLRDAVAEYNGGDGVNATQHGIVIDSTSSSNGGNGFTLGTTNSVCYARLSSYGNTATAITGGVAMVGSVTSCQ